MNNIDIYTDITNIIERRYIELGYSLGWSFLGCSKNNILHNSSIGLITLNPGGNIYTEPIISFEKGNIYSNEDWNGKGEGQEPLQIQIQNLFSQLLPYCDNYNEATSLMNESLIGYFIPFRSPTYKQLGNKQEAIKLAKLIWSKIISQSNLSRLICIDKITFHELDDILRNINGFQLVESSNMETGWGKITASVNHYKGNSSQISLTRLPHLSRYKIFNRTDSKNAIEKIIKESTRL